MDASNLVIIQVLVCCFNEANAPMGGRPPRRKARRGGREDRDLRMDVIIDQ